MYTQERCNTKFKSAYDIRREKDEAEELSLQKYFNRIYAGLGLKFDRTPERSLQLQGCDLVLYGNNNFIVDEKAATKYIDYDLKTYIFELSFKRRLRDGKWERVKGWFHDENKTNRTEYYSLAYVRAPEDHNNLNIVDRFEVVLIKKKALWDYLHSLGYASAEELIKMYENPDVPKKYSNDKYSIELKDGCKLIHSAYYEESPLNVQIRKEKLIELASANIVMTPRTSSKIHIYKNKINCIS